MNLGNRDRRAGWKLEGREDRRIGSFELVADACCFSVQPHRVGCRPAWCRPILAIGPALPIHLCASSVQHRLSVRDMRSGKD